MFSMTLVLVVSALLSKQWVTIMAKSFPVVHDRRQKTGWRRRIVNKEDLVAKEWRLRQRLGWAPVLGPCLSRIPPPKILNIHQLQWHGQWSQVWLAVTMSWFYSGCWRMKDQSKILDTCLTFSATFPSFSKCWWLEDGKNVKFQNFCGLKIRF